MALEGNLTDFGLSEILQLIAVQQKSGMLSINKQDRSTVLFFRSGKIISTRDRRRKSKDPLKDYLTRYGVLSRNDLIKIMQISAQSKLDITEIIVSENFLSDEEMKKHFRNHIQETTHEILTWQQCSYKFMPGRDIIEGMKTLGEYNIEGILMESMRRIDEFPQMLQEFHDEKMMISKTKSTEPDEDLSENEKAILDLLKVRRSLFYLVAHSKMPSFETYEALKHLKEKELIKTTIELPGEDQGGGREGARKPSRERRLARFAPVCLLSLAFCGAAIAGFRSALVNLRPQPAISQNILTSGSLARSRTEKRLKWLLEAYYAEKGFYPRELSQLKDADLATANFMRQIKRFSFRYYLTHGKNTYTLL